ncbi:MAG: homocysteine S-methyltransferase family protein [Pseudomonadota bacterium]
MTDIVLLDGGMGQELIHRAGNRPTPLWSTQVMRDQPELVRAVHDDYRDAGATVHTANTYAILRDRLAGSPFEDEFAALYDTALTAAAGSGRIAGSMGPLGASYRPDLIPPHAEAVAAYTEIAQILAPHVDLFLGETIVSVAHARAVLEAAANTDKPVWIALSVMDVDGSRLRSGEPLEEVFAVADGAAAILANCSVPEAINTAVDVLATSGKPFGAYANGFTHIADGFLGNRPTVDALSARKDLGPDTYADFAMGWVAKGATIVGGCCEVGPAHIARLAETIRAAGHRIVTP